VKVSHEEIQDLKKFIILLNSKNGSAVVVEGKRDSAALKKIGYAGIILEFHRFGGLRKFVDSVSKYESLIMLLDGDKKGRYLTAKIVRRLERRKRIDLSFKKRLVSITKGKIRFIEELGCYESFLQ
jgi:5S rRNA maturation endonuclease (ribonuclease M5)